jgi:hypothetical protein
MSEITGIPSDLAAVLKDPGVIVPQDARVFELIAGWAKAPTPTLGAPVSVVYDVNVLQHLASQTQVMRATTGVGA